MNQNQLFKQLCSQEIILTGWHLAHADSRDNFVLDPVGHVDFTSHLDERLKHLVEQVQTHRYRPRHLTDIDLPKSGLSVRPGNVLPIEESILLHAITCLIAPLLDKQLDKRVYSYRLHPDWKKRVKKRTSLFRESKIEFPFLRRATIRSISPFDAWYERWPEFEAASRTCTQDGFTHLTKTDITAYFENIDLRLLETQIRSLLKGREEKIIHLLFRILEGWTRDTITGTPIGRGIPQGNEISSFLGNIYLIPLDKELIKFCRQHNAKWFRYVDDVKVFTKSEEDARQAVFIINDSLRSLHLNLQGSKTEILSDKKLTEELDDSEIKKVDDAFEKIKSLNPDKQNNSKKISEYLRNTGTFVSRFRRNLPESVKNLSGKNNRLFRRLMTIYGHCRRAHLKKSAFTALKELPDLRILEKSLTYLSQLDYGTHDEIADTLFKMLESRQLPFPYQTGSVLRQFQFFTRKMQIK
ncbi:MAG: Reverse transcriptase (RNA-dependent DNA polymerase) [Planctomycetes bacterium ADurb.Bin401]|nr:MAG: Reverse transcriptase (RNA-dependent DNA polymerase) [Planctomycetes bacterium ADurb.Bin401]